MVSTAQPRETEADEPITALDLLHAFFGACAATRAVRLRRIVGDDLARLRAAARAATATLVAEQGDVLGAQWDSVQREAEVVGTLRAALVTIRAKVFAALAILLATAASGGANEPHRALARRVVDAISEKVGHVAHVALTARIAPTGGVGIASMKMLGGLSPA
jgi:hypothetical protein